MKKIFTFLIMFLLFIVNINAEEFKCTITGSDSMYPLDEERSEFFFITNYKINIENIDKLSSFNMYISFDNKLYDIKGCAFLNNEIGKCKISDNKVTYSYSSSSKNNLKNDFYTLSLKSNDTTPNKGESNIKVYFEKAKDKNKNAVTIDECYQTISFKEVGNFVVPSENTGNEIEDSNPSVKIKKIDIKGYNLELKDDVYEYDLEVDNDVNKLDIELELEDKNAKYTITGASDLNSFGNKVIINVTSSDNEEQEYKINIIKEKKEINTTDIKEDIKKSSWFQNIKDNYLIIIGGIILIILLILIIRKLSSKKLDKYLDNL